MIYFLWTLLNFGLLIFFILTCFRATKLIRERLGMFAAFIFVVGLLSFVQSDETSSTKANESNQRTSGFVFKTPAQIEPNYSLYATKPIDTYVGSTLNLEVMFGKEKLTGKTVATEADFSILGLVGGHRWVPAAVSISPLSNTGNYTYHVAGSLKWTLLGFVVFSQTKTLKGSIAPK